MGNVIFDAIFIFVDVYKRQVLGMAATYIFGALWLAAQMELSFTAALSVGVLPYLLGDAVKIAAASIVGPILQNRLFLDVYKRQVFYDNRHFL